MDKVQVRPATRREIPEVIALLYELGRPRPGSDSDFDEFRRLAGGYATHDDRAVLVAIRDGVKVVGAASVVFLPRLNRIGPEMYVPDLVVQSGFRRRGIGRMLVGACVRLAEKRGCHRIRLESGNERGGSHRFYLDLGFEQSALSFSLDLGGGA